jgi:hypothetical protein
MASPDQRRLTKQQFIDRTMVRWKGKDYKRVAQRDRELAEFVYEQLMAENYAVAFPDATED